MPKLNIVEKARTPKNERRCQRCGKEIFAGEKYYWWSNRVGFGKQMKSKKTVRCENHKPESWEMSGNPSVLEREENISDWSAQAAELESAEDAKELLGEIATYAEERQQEEEEKADNIRDGFGHDTFQSEELDEKAQAWDEFHTLAADAAESGLPAYPVFEDPDELDAEDDPEYFQDAEEEWEEYRELLYQAVENVIEEMP